jgi:arylsulfatase A-like enzyme/uncharacterized membrane protein YbhN (UPF0104 family)
MLVLLEILAIAIAALVVRRVLPEPWRGRVASLLKAWVTVRAFWLLLEHPVKREDGTPVVAWRLVWETLANIDHGTFWTFCALAAGVKFVGILASMHRWTLLLRGQGVELPFRHIFGSFLIGRFIGTFLPSTAGLDGYKLFDAARFSGKTVEATAATLLEKILGFSGIFLSFLVALPFGIVIFGERAGTIAALTVPICVGVIAALLVVLFRPGLVSLLLAKLPLPGKARMTGIVTRISKSASAYRDKHGLVIAALSLSFVVHFTTAAMYYFTALAIGADRAEFWPVVFGSSIQIFATVLSPFTIAGEGIREAAQYVLLGHMIGAGNAIVSAALGFWAAEALTLFGGIFWWIRGKDYRPAYCLADGRQVDYEAAARAAASFVDQAGPGSIAVAPAAPLAARAAIGILSGLAAGVVGGLLVGAVETAVIAAGGFGAEAQALWWGPLVYGLLFGALGAGIGLATAIFPMDAEEMRGVAPAWALTGTLVPIGLAISVFRVRRDVFAEQMPPLPVLLAILAAAGLVALVLSFGGPKFFRGPLRALAKPVVAAGLLAIATLGGALAARSFAVPPDRAPERAVPAELAAAPNLILVMIDTLRADHLSCYGGPVAAPAICGLAEGNGAIFDGFSHASWTKPAAASLLTGLLPKSHAAMSKTATLAESLELLPELLKERGYTTGGVVSNINLAESFGFRQGYDEYRYLAPDYLLGAEESSSKLVLYSILRAVRFKLARGYRVGDFYQDSVTVNEVALDFVARQRDSRFFLFLHYMDPHDPYFEHPYNGRAIARVSNQHPDPALADEMRRLYAGEVAHVDASFGRVIEKLRELGIYENTAIALVSDHGEEFHEHGGFWHGLTLYDEQIRVPLLVKWPHGEALASGDQRGWPARLVDVAPTLLARAGVPVLPAMPGRDLGRLPPDARADSDRLVFAEEDHEGNVLRALRSRDWKWIEANAGNPRGLPLEQLFEVSRDPGERKDLRDANPARVAALRDQAIALEQHAGELTPSDAGSAQLSDAQKSALESLGYLQEGGAAPPPETLPKQNGG